MGEIYQTGEGDVLFFFKSSSVSLMFKINIIFQIIFK